LVEYPRCGRSQRKSGEGLALAKMREAETTTTTTTTITGRGALRNPTRVVAKSTFFDVDVTPM
jgi:hypothetical protein